jgi:hypothetical protein
MMMMMMMSIAARVVVADHHPYRAVRTVCSWPSVLKLDVIVSI